VSQIAAADIDWMVGAIGYEPEEEVFAADHAGAGKKVEWPAQLTPEQLEQVYELAGVPTEWREPLARIAWCESHWSPGAVGDSGNSLGLHQLWIGWARDGEDLMDPVTNSRVAVRIRETRGRFGGGGGWTCAEIVGVK